MLLHSDDIEQHPKDNIIVPFGADPADVAVRKESNRSPVDRKTIGVRGAADGRGAAILRACGRRRYI
jgi:hypothetical protein